MIMLPFMVNLNSANLLRMKYVKAMRLFQDEPKWTPLNRGGEVDANPHRKSYVDTVLQPTAAVN